MVTIVYLGKKRYICTEQEAIAICSDKKVRGSIIDAITADKKLQTRLRAIIDR